jgi:hypothetical protein
LLLSANDNNRRDNERMAKATQIRSVETLACDAGWRNYHFVKITTEDGIVGWSEYDEGFGAPGVTAAIVGAALYVMGVGLFALALGAIVRNTAGGISAFAAIFFVIPPLLDLLPSSWNDTISPQPGKQRRPLDLRPHRWTAQPRPWRRPRPLRRLLRARARDRGHASPPPRHIAAPGRGAGSTSGRWFIRVLRWLASVLETARAQHRDAKTHSWPHIHRSHAEPYRTPMSIVKSILST